MVKGEGERGKQLGGHGESKVRKKEPIREQRGPGVGTNPVKGLRMSLYSISPQKR
jgi:hypothetical protein